MRAVLTLAIAQAFASSGMLTIALLGGILGSEFAPAPYLATLPVSLAIVGLAAATIPAAYFMQRVGRRSAFIAGALTAAAAAILATWAITQANFAALCCATFLMGSNQAFVAQQRFAAAESVLPGRVSQAVSLVMLGTLVAALIGPQLALALKNLLPEHEYAGSFLGVAVLFTLSALVLTRYRVDKPVIDFEPGAGRPTLEIVRQPTYLLAALAAVVSYAVMSFIMTATPISMHVHDHHSDTATAWVIQSHLLAMYAPSLFSGALISRIGTRTGMFMGLALMLICVMIDSAGRDLMHYWSGLVLLGLGWNLLFVSGTSLLTTTYRPQERFRAQAVNEFAVFGTQALASLMAGPAIHLLGWHGLNLAALLPLLLFGSLLLLPQVSRNSRV